MLMVAREAQQVAEELAEKEVAEELKEDSIGPKVGQGTRCGSGTRS